MMFQAVGNTCEFIKLFFYSLIANNIEDKKALDYVRGLELDQPLGKGCWACHWKSYIVQFLIHKKKWHLPCQLYKMTSRLKTGNMYLKDFEKHKVLYNVWDSLFIILFYFCGDKKEEEDNQVNNRLI